VARTPAIGGWRGCRMLDTAACLAYAWYSEHCSSGSAGRHGCKTAAALQYWQAILVSWYVRPSGVPTSRVVLRVTSCWHTNIL
jgi:hypothetical protein